MSYPKANLGAVVLPVPTQLMTWEEYKDTYGIDLDEIFAIELGHPHFKSGFSKIVYMCDYVGGQSYFNGLVMPISVVNVTHSEIVDIPEDGVGIALVYVQFATDATAGGSSGIVIIGNRTITYYDN